MTQTASAAPTASDLSRGRGRWAIVVYLLFFLSGLTSLVYEVIWVRQFGLVFGVTTYAVSTVLAAFFAGLAVGSYVAGRVIDRTRLHPLLVYGAMEGVIGAYALLLPFLLKLVEGGYPAVYSLLAGNFTLFTLFRFLISFIVLMVPATLMGATLPVLSKLMVVREDVLGRGVGRLYAVNTFGAVVGTFSAGFLLIPALGIWHTTMVAALGNFFLALMAALVSVSPDLAPHGALSAEDAHPVPAAPSRKARADLEETGRARERPSAGRVPLTTADRVILLLAFTSGLATLALEVVWTRSLVLILGSTTYAFSTMLTAVLVGIALGSAVFAPLADRTRNRAALVSFLLFLGGLCAALGPAIINGLPFVFLRLYDWAYGFWFLLIAAQFAVCFLLVFVPTFLSGASFPILVRMYSRGAGRVGRTVADVYAVNTLGGIIGSLIGGFVLVKLLGLQPALLIAAFLLMLVGGGAAMAIAKPWHPGARAAVAVVMALAVLVLGVAHPKFSRKLLFGGWGPYGGGYYSTWLGGSTVDISERYMQWVRYHKEGATASVDVLESGWGERIISINAKPVATTYLYDMRALKMLGHLPVLVHPNPEQVLIIGLGAGVSSGIIASYPAVKHVTVVELCEEVPGGAEQFADWNYDAMSNDKLEWVINDGANYVKATKKQYDVISADPIHPFVSGAGTLYSYEHWMHCRDRLREGGILAQWLPLYQLSPRDFATIVGTFTDAFPDASIWFCGIDTVLIGCKGPIRIDPDRLAEQMSDPVVLGDLLSMGVHRPGDVLGWFVAGPEQMRQMGLGAVRNRADFPILEFSAPKAVSLRGVASTMPALLTALEQVPPQEAHQRLDELCTRPLDPQTRADVETMRTANRWLMRGQMLYSYGMPDQYLEAARRALAARPTDTFVRKVVGDALFSVGDDRMVDGYSAEAYQYYRDAYISDPGNVMALTEATRAAIQMGDLELAEQTMGLTMPEHEDVFQVRVYRGWLAIRRLLYHEARREREAARRQAILASEYLEQAAAPERDQESPMLHVGLGFLALREGESAPARRHFARALEVSTDPMDAVYDIVDLCSSAGLSSEVRSYASQLVTLATVAIASDPGQPYLYHYRALGYEALGEDAKAERDRATRRSLLGWWEEPAVLPFVTPQP